MAVDASGEVPSSMRDAGAPSDAGDGGHAALDAAPDDAGRDAGSGLGPIVGDDYVDFGALAVPESGIVRVSVQVPDGERAFVLSADPGAWPRRVSLLSLRGPDGSLWFDGTRDELPGDFSPGVPANIAATVPYAFMLPSSPERPLLPGSYEVSLHAAGSIPASSLVVDAVFQKLAPAVPAQLGVVLWAAGDALDAAALRDDPELMASFAAAADIYAAVGITLVLRDVRTLDGAAQAQLAVLDDDTELGALLALLAEQGGDEPAANVVWVDRIESAPGKTVLAKSTGIPGPPAHPALPRRSAVVVSAVTLPSDARVAGALLAHELGHLLGLRHTTEQDGTRHDPIADTPECQADDATQTDSSGAPLLSAEDCALLDGENLMFYTPPQSTQNTLVQETLTAGQAYVLMRSPLLR